MSKHDNDQKKKSSGSRAAAKRSGSRRSSRDAKGASAPTETDSVEEGAQGSEEATSNGSETEAGNMVPAQPVVDAAADSESDQHDTKQSAEDEASQVSETDMAEKPTNEKLAEIFASIKIHERIDNGATENSRITGIRYNRDMLQVNQLYTMFKARVFSAFVLNDEQKENLKHIDHAGHAAQIQQIINSNSEAE